MNHVKSMEFECSVLDSDEPMIGINILYIVEVNGRDIKYRTSECRMSNDSDFLDVVTPEEVEEVEKLVEDSRNSGTIERYQDYFLSKHIDKRKLTFNEENNWNNA